MNGGEIQLVPLDAIQRSPKNREVEHDSDLESLANSIRQKGVLQPIILRTLNGKAKGGALYELVAGERRWRASRLAERDSIPAIVREGLSDQEAFEITLIENLQRRDLTPLEEAEGYQQLLQLPGASVAQVAARIGRSVQYVYDRAKLLNLVDEAQQLLRVGRITAGHAVILARLQPKDQRRLLEGDLFESEKNLLVEWEERRAAEQEDDLAYSKVISVRELQAIVDKNIRFDAEPDPMLFPETVDTLAHAREEELKVVSITHEGWVPPSAKDGTRIYGPRSWKSADGNHDGKPCEHSVVGVIVVGRGRGSALRVCVAKKKCKIHWAKEQSASAKAAKSRATSGLSGDARWKEQQSRQQAEEERFKKARPAIFKSIAERIAKAPAGATSHLAKLVIDAQSSWRNELAEINRLVKPGKTAEDLVRYLAFLVIWEEEQNGGRDDEFAKLVKPLGVDVAKIIEAENAEAPSKAAAAKSGSAAKKSSAKKAKK